MKRTSVPDRWTLVFQPRRLLGLCYAVGVMLWLVWAILGSALMLTHKTDGSMRHQILTPEELTYESFRNYDDDPWSTAPMTGATGTFPPTTTPTSSGRGRLMWRRCACRWSSFCLRAV